MIGSAETLPNPAKDIDLQVHRHLESKIHISRNELINVILE
jgi:hypothetical protein